MYPMDTICQVQKVRKPQYLSNLKISNLKIRIDLVPWHTSGFE